MQSNRKPRAPRVERSEEMVLHDETEHLWAVSYADFLMVLLSFFILFFSVDKEDKSDVIRRVLSLTDSAEATSEKAGAGGGAGSGVGESEEQTFASIVSLEDQLKGFKYYKDEKNRKLVLDFPDNVYPTGDYYLDGKSSIMLYNFLKALEPLKGKVGITMVGFADTTPFDIWKDRLIRSNIDLSTMRATKAALFAQSMGYSVYDVQAKGVLSRDRLSRTLSIEVYPLKENQRTPASATVEPSTYYGVQVFASQSREEAYEFASKISYVPHVLVDKRKTRSSTWYRVTVGKSVNLSEAVSLRRRLRKASGVRDLMIRKIDTRSPSSLKKKKLKSFELKLKQLDGLTTSKGTKTSRKNAHPEMESEK